MAHIAVLGLGNWGSAIARLWLLEGHNVKGWTIEQEVYESITMEDMNHKYLPNQSLKGLEVTMRVEEALEGPAAPGIDRGAIREATEALRALGMSSAELLRERS